MNAVRQLLEACQLPKNDLTPSHLNYFVIAYAGGTRVGTIGMEPFGRVGLLRSLAVAPRHRGRGAGERLVEALEERAHHEHTEALYLLTTTAAGYFGRRGFESVGRAALPTAIRETEQVTRLCPASATCMKKWIAGCIEV